MVQHASPLRALQISSDAFASPFKKLMEAPFLLIAWYSGFMVAWPHVFRALFHLRVWENFCCQGWCCKPLAAFKQPAPSLEAERFPFVIYYIGHLSNCASLVQWLTNQCQGILQFKGTNQFVPLLSSLFVLSRMGMMHLWPRRKGTDLHPFRWDTSSQTKLYSPQV